MQAVARSSPSTPTTGAACTRAASPACTPARSAAGEVAATGRTVDALFSGIYEFEEGKITSFHLYFDQAELFTQLGIAAGSM